MIQRVSDCSPPFPSHSWESHETRSSSGWIGPVGLLVLLAGWLAGWLPSLAGWLAGLGWRSGVSDQLTVAGLGWLSWMSGLAGWAGLAGLELSRGFWLWV